MSSLPVGWGVGSVDYLSLDLLILRSAGGYRARVVGSPGGEGDAEFTLPEGWKDLERLLSIPHPDEPLSPSPPPPPPAAGVAVLPEIRAIQAGGRHRTALRPTAMADFGRRLFRAVFTGPVALAYRRSLDLATAEGHGLRIRLHLADAPEVLDLPWELLYDDARAEFVASSNATPVVRYLDLPRPVEVLPVGGPLRTLVVVSSPRDLPPLDVDAEWNRLTGALRPLTAAGRMSVERLETCTLDELVARLRQGGHHVVHYIGHGGFDEGAQQGILALEAADGSAAPVRAEDLAAAFEDMDGLRLVVLNSCQGARTSIVDPFAGVAQALVGGGVPAVVAMQFEVTDEAAVGFAQGFYAAVAAEASVDEAVTRSRLAMTTMGDGTEWVTPVLYSHTDDTRLFAFPWGTLDAPPDGLAALPGGGTVVAGGLAVQVEPVKGVRLDHAVAEVVPRARPAPVAVLPPPFPMLLGREAEVADAAGVGPGAMLRFSAGAGWGKTALLRAVANAEVGEAPAGLLYLRSLSRPAMDVVQFLFDELFETDVPCKPSDEQLGRWLGNVEATVVLDDAQLGEQDLSILRRAAPRCRFVVGGPALEGPPVTGPQGDGDRTVPLRGVPVDAGVRLVELELGRPLTDAERSDAAALCAALDGKPGLILGCAEQAWEQELPLAEVVARVRAAMPPGGPESRPVEPERIAALPAEARAVLGVLAAADPAPVHVRHLVDVVGLSDPLPVLESLERRGLIRSGSPLYALAFPATEAVRPSLEPERWAAPTVEHLRAWAGGRATPQEVLRDADLLLAAMRMGRGLGRADDVVALARAVEGPFIAGLRWGQWGAALSLELEAAAAGSVAAQALALHQFGSRAAGLGDMGTAREHLGRALELRRSIGDTEGAAVTTHNLEVIGGAPAAGPDGDGGGGGGGLRRWMLGGLSGLVGLGAIGFLIWFLAFRGGGAPGDPVRSVSSDRLQFGAVTVGSQSTLGVTVTNTGGGTLTVKGVSVQPVRGPFSSTSNCGALRNADTCGVTVSFEPRQTRTVNAVLLITDDTGSGSERVRLSGTGVQTSLPAVEFDPPSADFPEVTVDTTASRPVTVKNTGQADLDVQSLDTTGEGFSVTDRDCLATSVRPGGACTVDVSFAPTAPGGVLGELIVAANTGDLREVVPLTGEGVTAFPDLRVEGFDVVGVPSSGLGTVDVPVTFTVVNDGAATNAKFEIGFVYTVGNVSSEPRFADYAPGPDDRFEQSDSQGVLTPAMDAGERRTFTGTLSFVDKEEGATVTATAIADFCQNEDQPVECRVSEGDEGNNTSAGLAIDLTISDSGTSDGSIG